VEELGLVLALLQAAQQEGQVVSHLGPLWLAGAQRVGQELGGGVRAQGRHDLISESLRVDEHGPPRALDLGAHQLLGEERRLVQHGAHLPEVLHVRGHGVRVEVGAHFVHRPQERHALLVHQRLAAHQRGVQEYHELVRGLVEGAPQLDPVVHVGVQQDRQAGVGGGQVGAVLARASQLLLAARQRGEQPEVLHGPRVLDPLVCDLAGALLRQSVHRPQSFL